MTSIGRVRSTSRFGRTTMPTTVVGSSRATYESSTCDALEGDSQFVSDAFEARGYSLFGPTTSKICPSTRGPSLSVPITSETGSSSRGSSLSDSITSKTGPSIGGPSLSIPSTSETGSSSRGPKSSASIKKRGKSTSIGVEKFRNLNGNKRIQIHIRPDLFKPVTGYVKEWTTEIGIIARVNAPLLYENWTKIPAQHKQFLLLKVAEVFEVDINDLHMKESVEMHIKSRLRDYRHILKLHYDKFLPHEVASRNPYDCVPEDVWQKMCDKFNSDNFKKRSAINSRNRKSYKIPHCAGSKSFARYIEEERDKGTSGKVSYINLYKTTHHTIGKSWTHPDAEELYGQMITQSQAVQPASDDGTMTDDYPIFRAILGDNPYYSRGLGYGMKLTSSGRCTRAELEAARRRVEDVEMSYAEAMERVKQLEERMLRIDERVEQRINERVEKRIEKRIEQRIEEKVGSLIEERIRAMFVPLGPK